MLSQSQEPEPVVGGTEHPSLGLFMFVYAQMSRGGDAEGKPRYQTLARGLSVVFSYLLVGVL